MEINPRKPARDAAVVALITVALLVGSELLLRVVFAEKLDVYTEPVDLAYEFHEQYLVSSKPNRHNTFVRRDENGGDTIRNRLSKGANAD